VIVLSTRVARDEDPAGAVRVWRLANAARGLAPEHARVARVQAKVGDPGALLVVVCEAEQLVGMALAEPFREHDGAGQFVHGIGHISMVFVDPNRWGEGIGRLLVESLHTEMVAATWQQASLWTRTSNERAKRLYERLGYHATGDAKLLPAGDEIIRYAMTLS
jgi:ribosomal protein S18 acetylase RimI-like enzyme